MNTLDINKVFKVSTDKLKVICPPEQVFVRPDFDYLLTIGGDLIDNEYEYDMLKITLSNIGETEFYVLENLGATITGSNKPFKTTIDLNDDYSAFQEKVKSFDPPIGWYINHFFVYGQNENWGIYIAEFPTINIIGCDKKFSDKFRQTFSIIDNGYSDLKEFIEREFKSIPDHLVKFKKNYKL